MPTRFDQDLEELRRAKITPSKRLELLAELTTKMAEELARTARELAGDERRRGDLPVEEDRRAHP